jgi:hypothetical protein
VKIEADTEEPPICQGEWLSPGLATPGRVNIHINLREHPDVGIMGLWPFNGDEWAEQATHDIIALHSPQGGTYRVRVGYQEIGCAALYDVLIAPEGK